MALVWDPETEYLWANGRHFTLQIWPLDASSARLSQRPVRGLQRQRQEQRGPCEAAEPGAGRLRLRIPGRQQQQQWRGVRRFTLRSGW